MFLIKEKEGDFINFTDYIIPVFILLIVLTGFIKKVDVFNEFTLGAWESIRSAVDILPSLLALMTCVSLFRASGAADIISNFISPATDYLGFPKECVPLAIIRPVSGSGALAVYQNILENNHPDSFVGKVASVLMGSTETTFYTIAVYYGATKVKKTRQTLPASLSADITGFIMSAIIVRLLL